MVNSRTNKSVLISVIIPVYNIEKYLNETVDSVLQQSLKEIELICVDDGSSDGSLALLDAYKAEDSRVKVLEQANSGVGAARNNALQVAEGEYIYFMDSDDLLNGRDALEKIYEAASCDDIEILSFNHQTFGLEEKVYKRDMVDGEIIDGKSYMRRFGMWSVMVWLRLYQRSFLEKIDFRFVEGIISEDDEAQARLYYRAKKVKHIEDVILLYRKREGSYTASSVPKANLLRGLAANVKTYKSLYDEEQDKKMRYFLFNKALEYFFILYEKHFYAEERASALEQYREAFEAMDFTPFESKLIRNEELFIFYHEVQKKPKKEQPLVYYMRRLRIYYFRYFH